MIFERLREIVVEQLGISPQKFTLDSDIIKDIGADSLDLVEMLMNVEAEWDIIIDDDEVAGLHTVADVVALIEKKTA